MNTLSVVQNKTLNILIVEDESLIAYDVQCLLLDWGYGVVGIASEGAEAIELFNTHKPDLVLVDVNLIGDMDGVETVRAFNKIRKVPVIYLTAQSDFTTVNRVKSTNPAAFLLKPFDERHLNISIELALNNFHRRSTPEIENEEEQESETLWANEVKLNSDVILKKDDQIFIKQKLRFVSFGNDKLLYIEAANNHSYLYTESQKFVVRMSLAAILSRLDFPCIVRIHRSFAININYVTQFDEKHVIIDERDLPLSTSYKKDFYRHFEVI